MYNYHHRRGPMPSVSLTAAQKVPSLQLLNCPSVVDRQLIMYLMIGCRYEQFRYRTQVGHMRIIYYVHEIPDTAPHSCNNYTVLADLALYCWTYCALYVQRAFFSITRRYHIIVYPPRVNDSRHHLQRSSTYDFVGRL